MPDDERDYEGLAEKMIAEKVSTPLDKRAACLRENIERANKIAIEGVKETCLTILAQRDLYRDALKEIERVVSNRDLTLDESDRGVTTILSRLKDQLK